MNWLRYLLEANIYLCVFYGFYCLFLNRETYYTLNRVYLLSICVVSFVIPLIQVGLLKSAEVPVQTNLYAPDVQNESLLQEAMFYGYLLGVILVAALLTIKLYRLRLLAISSPTVVTETYKLINIEEVNTAFSFFNYLFISNGASEAETIIRHELVHIRQKHSVDIILMEIFKMINWFNPVVYLLQNSVKTVHEYIADEQTAAYETDAVSYSAFLLNNAYGINGLPVTNSFFNYNLLKRRIIMLNQQRSGSLARLKYFITVPLCAGLLCSSTLAFSKTYGFIDIAPKGGLPAIDTIKHKTHVKITDVKLLPPPPPPQPPVEQGSKSEVKKVNITDVKVLPAKKGVKKVTVTDIKLSPPPPAPPVITQGSSKRLPPPPPAPPVPKSDKAAKSQVKPKKDQVKFPPPVVTADAKPVTVLAKPKKDQVKFPPPVVRPNKPAAIAVKPADRTVKFPPPIVKPDRKVKHDVVKFPPPAVVPDKAAADKL